MEKRSDKRGRESLGLLGLALPLALLMSLWPDQAYAYLDPGTGSMIVQAVIAGIIGAGLAIRGLRFKIWSFFKKATGSKDEK